MTEESFNQMIGKNVKKYRLIYNANEGKVTQQSLASKIGVSASLIGALESTKMSQGISMFNLYKISEVLEVPIEKFFEK